LWVWLSDTICHTVGCLIYRAREAMEPSASFGAWVRRRRRQLDLTQVQLARQIGVAAITIQKIEADERRPSRQVAELLASQLQLPEPERQRFLQSARAELAVDRFTAPEMLPLPVAQHTQRDTLPHPLTRLIGRAEERATLTHWLEQGKRLMTLTGVGGSGKTRLAIQLGHAAVAMFPDGVWFVDLAPVSDASGVVPAIAVSLQIPESKERSLREGIEAWVGARHALLILDNFEHVVVAAPLVVELLQAAPALQMVITSRVPLRIIGEHEYAVQPLMLPDGSENGGRLEAMSQADAVQLFVERAQAVLAGFRLTANNASDVAAICTALDGLPLAIELAAARTRMFPPEQLLAQLTMNRFAILHGSAANIPARQRTMQATLDWSYRFLSADEQHLLNQIAVFMGGCDLPAVAAVCELDHAPLLGALDTLIAHSLIVVDAQSGSARYRMLETIRAYALERLRESQADIEARKRHAAYFLAFAEHAAQELRGRNEASWLDTLEIEHANLQVALAWCLETPVVSFEQQLVGWRIAAALWQFWLKRGHFQVWRHWMYDQVSTIAPNVPTELHGRLLIGAADWAMIHSTESEMRTLRSQADALLAKTEESWWHVYALGAEAWNTYVWYRDADRARALAGQLVQRAEQIGDPWLVAESYIRWGDTLNELSMGLEGLPELEHGLTLARRVGNPGQIVGVLMELGRRALYHGEPVLAQQHFSECLIIAQQCGTAYQQAVILFGLGCVAHLTGNLAMGRRIQQERLEIEQRLGNSHGVAAVYRELGMLEMISGNLELARRYLEQSVAHLPHPIQGISRNLTLLFEADLTSAEGTLDTSSALCQQLLVTKEADLQSLGHEILAKIALLRGDILEARRNLMISVRADSFTQQSITICIRLELLAAIVAAETQTYHAAQLWGSATWLREQYGIPMWPIDRPLYEQRVAVARAPSNTAEWDTAWEAGRGLSLEQARAALLQLLER
jgi:predicted ATPase/transcriptional regulator with XRE-family HTH domain